MVISDLKKLGELIDYILPLTHSLIDAHAGSRPGDICDVRR